MSLVIKISCAETKVSTFLCVKPYKESISFKGFQAPDSIKSLMQFGASTVQQLECPISQIAFCTELPPSETLKVAQYLLSCHTRQNSRLNVAQVKNMFSCTIVLKIEDSQFGSKIGRKWIDWTDAQKMNLLHIHILGICLIQTIYSHCQNRLFFSIRIPSCTGT